MFEFDLMVNVVVPVVCGAIGGLLTAVYKSKGNLELPGLKRMKTKTVLRLGFLNEVLLGAGAGAISTNVFYAINAMPQFLVGAIVASFAGLAGAKYLFKRDGDAHALDAEVENTLNFMANSEDEK